MIPLLTKLNCLPLQTNVRHYQLYSQNIMKILSILSKDNISSAYADDLFLALHLDLSQKDCHLAIEAILEHTEILVKYKG